MLLPTIIKEKIGETLTYPIGAERLNAVFEGIPQAEKSTISFLAKPTRASIFNEMLSAGDEYCILICRIKAEGEQYKQPPGTLKRCSWHLTIYPVLRELKPFASELLETQGLPKLRDFLLKTYRASNELHSPYFDVVFKPLEITSETVH